MFNNQSSGYLGNENIKRTGVVQDIPPEKIEEYIKCMDDPIYFAQNYVKIITLDDGFKNIELYPYQHETINSFNNFKNTIVLQPRQSGKSVTAVCIILHYILYNDYKTVALLANKASAAREVLSRVKMAYEALPKWMQQGVKEWNKGSIELENGTKVLAEATSGTAIRGKSCNFVYIDETAFVENWEEFYSSVYPTISSGKSTKILFTSTPNGLNHFYEFWTLAHKGPDSNDWNGFNPIKVEWDEVPGRDEEWKEKTLRAMNFNITKFNVEFACQFEGSSQTLISGAALRRLEASPPIAQEQFVKQYARVEEGHMYALVADVARGVGGDYSAFSVIDISEVPYKQVCIFRDNMTNGIDYAQYVHRFAKYYNNAYVLVEINDNGQQISDLLHHEYEYENVISTKSNGRSGKKATLGGGIKMDRGIRTTKTVKNIGCTMLQMLIENDKLVINDSDTIQELSKFIRKGNSYQAEPGFHDDIVMGLVLFSWLSDQGMFKELTDEDILKHLREKSDEQVMDSLLPFGVNAQNDEHDFDQFYELEPEIINW